MRFKAVEVLLIRFNRVGFCLFIFSNGFESIRQVTRFLPARSELILIADRGQAIRDRRARYFFLFSRASFSLIRALTSFFTSAAGSGLFAGKRMVPLDVS